MKNKPCFICNQFRNPDRGSFFVVNLCVCVCLVYASQAAKHLIDKTPVDQDSTATESDEQAEPQPCSSSQIATVQFVPW